MNFFITDNEGAHPVSLDDFRFIQEAYLEGFDAVVQAMVPEGTTEALLSGCVLDIDTDLLEWSLSAGFVYLGGEIVYVPAQEGTMEDAFQLPVFSILETYLSIDPILYADGEEHHVHQIRTAELSFVNDPEADEEWFAYDDLSDVTDLLAERLGLPDVEQDISDLEQDVADLGEAVAVLEEDVALCFNQRVPIGSILMTNKLQYFDQDGAGLVNTDWEGFQILNGNFGTEDWSGQFLVVYDANDPDYAVGATGGQNEVVLDIENLPAHAHGYNEITDDGAGNSLSGGGNDAYQKVPPTPTETEETGDNVPFDNRPIYKAIVLVQKIA